MGQNVNENKAMTKVVIANSSFSSNSSSIAEVVVFMIITVLIIIIIIIIIIIKLQVCSCIGNISLNFQFFLNKICITFCQMVTRLKALTHAKDADFVTFLLGKQFRLAVQ